MRSHYGRKGINAMSKKAKKKVAKRRAPKRRAPARAKQVEPRDFEEKRRPEPEQSFTAASPREGLRAAVEGRFDEVEVHVCDEEDSRGVRYVERPRIVDRYAGEPVNLKAEVPGPRPPRPAGVLTDGPVGTTRAWVEDCLGDLDKHQEERLAQVCDEIHALEEEIGAQVERMTESYEKLRVLEALRSQFKARRAVDRATETAQALASGAVQRATKRA